MCPRLLSPLWAPFRASTPACKEMKRAAYVLFHIVGKQRFAHTSVHVRYLIARRLSFSCCPSLRHLRFYNSHRSISHAFSILNHLTKQRRPMLVARGIFQLAARRGVHTTRILASTAREFTRGKSRGDVIIRDLQSVLSRHSPYLPLSYLMLQYLIHSCRGGRILGRQLNPELLPPGCQHLPQQARGVCRHSGK